jgi:hypothetical protein
MLYIPAVHPRHTEWPRKKQSKLEQALQPRKYTIELFVVYRTTIEQLC